MGTGLATMRTAIGALLLSIALPAGAFAQDRESVGSMRQQLEDVRPRAPLAEDIDRRLRTERGIEHELNLEQSRVGARLATPLQRYQTSRDVQLSRQNLDTLKTRTPQAKPVPVLERKLDRVSRPTGQVSGSRGLESGYSTSLGLSGSASRR